MLITSQSEQLLTSWMQLWFCHFSPAGPINLQLCHCDNGSEDSAATVILQPWYRLKHRHRLNCKTKWKTAPAETKHFLIFCEGLTMLIMPQFCTIQVKDLVSLCWRVLIWFYPNLHFYSTAGHENLHFWFWIISRASWKRLNNLLWLCCVLFCVCFAAAPLLCIHLLSLSYIPLSGER